MIARVAVEHRNAFVLRCDDGVEMFATLAGRLRYETSKSEDLPAVGDFVRVRDSVIEELLPRRTVILRKAAGAAAKAQVIAANIDTIFVVTGLDEDYNPRRLERYFAAVRSSGAQAVIVLNKSDLCENLEDRLREVRSIAPGADVAAISALNGEGIGALRPYLAAGETVAFVGSSGAGKSTLINLLLGRERQLTGAVREADSRGRHTTTHRELIETPLGALLIDTPGLRELQPWAAEADVEGAFPDIEALADRCRFRDCAHASEEDGCAVHSAIEDGTLDPARFSNYLKLRKEAAYLDRQLDVRAQLETKAKWKKIHKAMRNFDKRT